MPLAPPRRPLLAGLALAALTLTCTPAAALAAASAPSDAAAPSTAPWASAPAHRSPVHVEDVVGSQLTRGQRLAVGDALRSPSGRYSLVLSTEGFLTLVKAANRVSPQPLERVIADGPASELVLQSDGNLVLYGSDGRPLLVSGTAGSDAQSLVMQDDGNVVLYGSRGTVLFQTGTNVSSYLDTGDSLLPGEALYSQDGGTTLVMQPDGNLVLYTRGTVRFATLTYQPGSAAVLQPDGNFVVYSPAGRAVFATGTFEQEGSVDLSVHDGEFRISSVLGDTGTVLFGSAWGTGTVEPGAVLYPGDRRTAPGDISLVMQPDGNLVEYVRGRAVFSTGTAGRQFTAALMQTDGNFVVYRFELYTDVATPVFSTRTGGYPGSRLVVQGDGNLVVRTAAGVPVYVSQH